MLSLKDDYIIITYHYVRDPSPEWLGIHPCPLKEFDRQVKFLSENFRTVSVPEVHEAAQKGLSGKFCALTFDDGFKDNYENALPILKKYKATGTFFIITSTFGDKLPLTHKLHILFSHSSPGELIDFFNSWSNGAHLISKDRSIDNRRKHGDMLTNNFKESMIALPVAVREHFLNFYFEKYGLDEKDLCRILFMNFDEVRKLASQGMAIGSHSHNHNSFEFLDSDSARGDLRTSRRILGNLLNKEVNIFSYPHGRYSAETSRLLQEEDFRYAVTIECRAVESKDNSFLIPRYDANDLQFLL